MESAGGRTRENEFSPVITGSWGSTSLGSAIVRNPFDDAQVALGCIAEDAQRLLVARAVMRRDGLRQATASASTFGRPRFNLAPRLATEMPERLPPANVPVKIFKNA